MKPDLTHDIIEQLMNEKIDTSPYVPTNPDELRKYLATYLDNRATHPYALSKIACEIATAIHERDLEIARLQAFLNHISDNVRTALDPP